MDATSPYRLFDLTVLRRTALTPALARFTFTGPEVTRMATAAPDQRVKLFFPDAAGRPADMPRRPDWYSIWKAMDEATRSPMRTYTIRHLRAAQAEVDVDFVLHGDSGPASSWAMRAAPGDKLQMTAPDAEFEGEMAGYEWKPPQGVRDVLLIADETALPALAGILDELARLPAPPTTQAFVEVPASEDRLRLPTWPRLEVTWMDRHGWTGDEPPMLAAARRARLPQPNAIGQVLPSVDIDTQILWDRAETARHGFYAWVAGEAGSVLAIRQHLVKERGLDRRALNLMGYWRRGRVLD